MNNPIYDRNKRKPSTFTVPQTPQPLRDKVTTRQQPKSEQPKPQAKQLVEIDMFLNIARRDSAQSGHRVTKRQGIRGGDHQARRTLHGGRARGGKVGIMKTAIATVAR